MTAAGVAELKARLSQYLARVKAGEEIVVTEHGRPIARLLPAQSEDARMAALARRGLIRPGVSRLPQGFLDAPMPRPRASVLEALIEERREGR